MKPLEDVIRESADRGKLNYLSIAHTPLGWEVAYRGVDHDDHRMVVHHDPVCAVMAALTGKPGEAPVKKRRASVARLVPTAATTAFDDLLG